MKRKNHAHLSFSSFREQWFERARRTQFHIEIFRARQKSPKQVTPFLKRQIADAAFKRITRSDDDRRGQDRHFAFELIDNVGETIESNFKKIRRLIHREGKSEI